MEERKMSNCLMILATLITAIATVAIACFTKHTLKLTNATHELSKAIKESSDRYQEDAKRLQIELATVTLYAAVNPPGKPLQSDKLKEFRKIITDSLNSL